VIGLAERGHVADPIHDEPVGGEIFVLSFNHTL
jgi:hypothetical protein